MSRRRRPDRGIPWSEIPFGPFEGALYCWNGEPPNHSARLEKSIYIKTANALVALNGTTWSFVSSESAWHVVGYRSIELTQKRRTTR